MSLLHLAGTAAALRAKRPHRLRVRWCLCFMLCGVLCLLAQCLLGAEARPTHVALVSSHVMGPASSVIDLATAELSQHRLVVLDRQDVIRAIQEQELTLLGLVDANGVIAVGKMLRADIFAVIQDQRKTGKPFGLIVFDAASGERLLDKALQEDPKTAARDVVGGVLEADKKRLEAEGTRATVCVLPIRNTDASRRTDYECEALRQVLERHLTLLPGVTVLERSHLDHVTRENALPSDAPLLRPSGAQVLIEIEIQQTDAERVATVDMRTASAPVDHFSVRAPASNGCSLVEGLVEQISARLGQRAPAQATDREQEARRFDIEARDLRGHKRLAEAVACAHAAHALAPTPRRQAAWATYQVELARHLMGDWRRSTENIAHPTALAYEAHDARLAALRSCTTQNAVEFTDHLHGEWRGFDRALFVLPGTLFAGGPQERQRRALHGTAPVHKGRRYAWMIAKKWGEMAPGDALAMNCFSWSLAGEAFCDDVNSLLFPLEVGRTVSQPHAPDLQLALTWLDCVRNGFGTRAPAIPDSIRDGTLPMFAVGTEVQGVDCCHIRIVNGVLRSFVRPFGVSGYGDASIAALLLPHMETHPLPLVRAYAAIGQHLQTRPKRDPSMREPGEPLPEELRDRFRELAEDAPPGDAGDDDRLRAYLAWIDLVQLAMRYDNARFPEFVLIWQHMLDHCVVPPEDALRKLPPEIGGSWRHITPETGMELRQLCQQTLNRYDRPDTPLYPPHFLLTCQALLSRFAPNNQSQPSPWHSATVLFDGNAARPIVSGDLVYAYRDSNRSLLRISLQDGTVTEVSSLPPPAGKRDAPPSKACLDGSNYYIGSYGNGLSVFPLNGSEPWRVTEDNGLPSNRVYAVCSLSGHLYVSCRDGDESFLAAVEPVARKCRVIASNRRRVPRTPLDELESFPIPYIIADPKRSRIVFYVYASTRDERDSAECAGLWQMDLNTEQISKIPGPWFQYSWVSPIDAERFLMVYRTWSLVYDLRTDTARAMRLTGDRFSNGDPARVRNDEPGYYYVCHEPPPDEQVHRVTTDEHTVHTWRIATCDAPEAGVGGDVWMGYPLSRCTADGRLEVLPPIINSRNQQAQIDHIIYPFDDGRKVLVGGDYGLWILHFAPQ